MASIPPVTICNLYSVNDGFGKKHRNFFHLSSETVASLCQNKFRLGAYMEQRRGLVDRGKFGIWVKVERLNRKKRVVVRFNEGFGFNGGGGGGRNNGGNARILGNIALAIGLTYLSVTGQLGWVLDAIVSVWLLVVLVPILGLGAFLWWAGRDIVQSSCPNCGNDFQIFKSSLDDEVQLCPFCSQPFSVVDDKFVKELVKFSNQTTNFGQGLDGFSSRSNKGKVKDYASSVVDVEAEVKDAD